MKAEIKVQVQSNFLARNGGLEANWARGFQEEEPGIFTKVIDANELILEQKLDDQKSK